MKKNAIIILMGMIISGCSWSIPNHESPSVYRNLGHNVAPIYALLVADETGYEFKKFSTYKPNQSGPWVNIITGSPTWNTTSELRCGVGLVKSADINESLPSCSDVVNEDLFYEKQFSKGENSLRVIAALGSAGLTLTGATYNVKFDTKKYISAFEEAQKKAIERGHLSESIITDVHNGLSKAKKEHEEYSIKYRHSISTADITINIIDRSGFLINDQRLKQHISRNIVKLNPNKMTMPEYNFQADDPRQLIEKINDLRQSSIRSYTSASEEVKIEYSSNEMEFENFKYKVSAPTVAKLKNENFKFDVNVNVSSRSFLNVKPSAFTAEDQVLALELIGDRISLRNKSKKFIKVESIALYYNTKVSTLSGLGIDLSPETSLLEKDFITLNRFPVDSKEVSYMNLTRDQARRLKVKYGFAIKYRTLDTNMEKTIYITEDFNLLDLVTI